MKAVFRSIGLFGCVTGLVTALAPAAGASPVAPLVQSISFTGHDYATNPCNGAPVATTGTTYITTVTTGQLTVAGAIDNESGDGYSDVGIFAGTFNSLSSSYSLPGEYTFYDVANPALSFHVSVVFTLYVSPTNAPTGLLGNISGGTCGLV